jgi:hypothetical protein
MITNTGKAILAKFLAGYTPSYASYMVFGSGAKPLLTTTTPNLNELKTKETLEFETFRAPIISRGFVTDVINDTDVSRIVFTAEIPSLLQYKITEVGIVPAKSNPSATFGDSRMLYGFTSAENWQLHANGSVKTPDQVISLLNAVDSTNIADEITNKKTFKVYNSDSIFSRDSRVNNYEGGRYLDEIIVLCGNSSDLQSYNLSSLYGEKFTDILQPVGNYNYHIHLLGSNLDLSKNSVDDKLKLAYTVIRKNETTTNIPSSINILIQFVNNDENNSVLAQMQIIKSNLSSVFSNRYFVETQSLSDLKYFPGFSWQSVSSIKVYASAKDAVIASSIQVSGENVLIRTATRTGFTPNNSLSTNFTPKYSDLPIISEVDNLIPNPNFNVDTTDWFATGSGVVSSESGIGNYHSGSKSLKLTATSLNDSVKNNSITVDGSGNTINVSLWIKAVNSFSVTLFCNSNSSSVSGTGSSSWQNINLTLDTNSLINTVYLEIKNTNNDVNTIYLDEVTLNCTNNFSVSYPADSGTTPVTKTSQTGYVESVSDNFLIGLDGLRFENISNKNPLYGLVGYAVVQSDDAQPITKNNNSTNYVEFRFGLDVA